MSEPTPIRSAPRHWERAGVAHAAEIEVALNEYGVPVSVHECSSCGREFTVCPPAGPEWGTGCLDPGCASYDPARDVDHLFTDPEENQP